MEEYVINVNSNTTTHLELGIVCLFMRTLECLNSTVSLNHWYDEGKNSSSGSIKSSFWLHKNHSIFKTSEKHAEASIKLYCLILQYKTMTEKCILNESVLYDVKLYKPMHSLIISFLKSTIKILSL